MAFFHWTVSMAFFHVGYRTVSVPFFQVQDSFHGILSRRLPDSFRATFFKYRTVSMALLQIQDHFYGTHLSRLQDGLHCTSSRRLQDSFHGTPSSTGQFFFWHSFT